MNIFRSAYKHICKTRAFPWGVSRVSDNEARPVVADTRTLARAGPGERCERRVVLGRGEGGGGREFRARRYHLNFNESCGCKCRPYSFTVHTGSYSCVCKISSLPRPASPSAPRSRSSACKEETNVGDPRAFFLRGAFTVPCSTAAQRCLAIQAAATKADYLRSFFVS